MEFSASVALLAFLAAAVAQPTAMYFRRTDLPQFTTTEPGGQQSSFKPGAYLPRFASVKFRICEGYGEMQLYGTAGNIEWRIFNVYLAGLIRFRFSSSPVL
jgi:hypothetical protein